MNKFVAAACWLMVIVLSGCAQTLPPHEGLNQAFKKSFDATGLNYSSKNRITNLSISEKSELADLSDKRIKYLGSSIDIVRSLSVNTDGAIDMKTKRSEVLYDLRYAKDNVEVSIKLPLLVDYNTRTVYVGQSFLNTIFETLYPQLPSTKGGLLKININELLQENAASSKELSTLLGGDRFSSKNLDILSSAFKDGILKSLAKVNHTCFSDLPLTEQDKKTDIARRIHVILGHKDSVSVVLNLIDGVSQSLFRDGIITKDEYAVLLVLTDRQKLEAVTDQFSLSMIIDAGISQSGFVGYLESQINVGDKDGVYQLGLNNVSSFSNYNLPHFSINPEKSSIVDFKQVLDAIKADTAKKEKASPSNLEGPDSSNKAKEATP